MIAMKVVVTAFCLCPLCTRFEHGITFSGAKAEVGITAACGAELYGKIVYIPDVGVRFCEDTGSKVRGRHVDVLVGDHETAKSFSRRTVTAYIIGEWWDGNGRTPQDTPRTASLDR